MASTDAGRAKWVESLANDLGVGAAFILKRRLKGDHTEVSAINADVAGKTVVIYDDMIRSGGSIINAAKIYKECRRHYYRDHYTWTVCERRPAKT